MTRGNLARTRARTLLLALCCTLGGVAQAQGIAAATVGTLSRGVMFKDVQIHRPAGTIQQFVLLLTAGIRPSPREHATLQSLLGRQALVAMVPYSALYARMAGESQRDQCVTAPGTVEDFARYVQAYEKLPSYIQPILVGSGEAGGFVYATLAQTKARAFTGGLSLDFCPRTAPPMPMCPVGGLRAQASPGVQELEAGGALPSPWTALATDPRAACTGAAQGFVQRVPGARWASSTQAAGADALPAGFDAAFDALAAQRAPLAVPPAEVAGIPVTEVPVARGGARFAVLVSGDGGWADIDKKIAAALARDGVPVVGVDSLRYFWTARKPEGVAQDLDRVVRYYAHRWQRSEVILIGYSQGADVLPFAINRLPQPTRDMVRLTVLIGPGHKASFEFHVTNWIGKSGDQPIAPEASRLKAADTLCIYGTDETSDSLCPGLAPAHAQVIGIRGGHHLDGNYDGLAARILAAVPAR